MSEQVPEATKENLVQMLKAEMDAHCKIADLCFAAGAVTDDGTSVGAVRGLVKLLAQAQASLAAARAQALEPFEQLVIDMRAIGKMLGAHQLASIREDYARRAANAQAHWKCKASAANTGANDPQDCDWPTCGCDPSDPALAKLLAEERLDEANLAMGLFTSEGDAIGMHHQEKRIAELAARVAELKGRKDSV